MSYKIIVTDSAENDIASIINYIANELGNNSAALSLIASIKSGMRKDVRSMIWIA